MTVALASFILNGFMREWSSWGDHVLHRLEDTDHAFLLAEYTDNLSACLLGIRILDKEIQYAFDEENAPIE